MQRQVNTRIQTQKAPKDVNQYLADLDALLKRNTGSGTHIGADVSSNIPMYIPGKVFNPTGLGDVAPSIAQAGRTSQPEPVARDIQELDIPQEETESVLGASDFLDLFDQIYNETNHQAPGLDQSGAMATGVQETADGGVLFSDGIIYYNDGTFRAGEPTAQAIASDVSGGTKYSDGSIRMSYEQVGLPQQSTPGGLGGLISGIFGQDRAITQDFGNYNPSLEPGSGYNMGTDIRTKDLTGSQRQYKLPVGAEVIQVFRDDGTRFGDQTGHQGWGNSVLLKLPSGEMLRFSHMSQMANLQEGQRIEAGQVFGEAGQTGNTNGEHLDLEYYNQAGQLGSPDQFSGFTNPQSNLQPKMFSSESDPQAPTVEQPQAQFSPQVEQPQQILTPVSDAISNVAQAPKNIFNAVQPLSEPRQQLSGSVEAFGRANDIPEMYASEVTSGQMPLGQAVSKNIEENAPKTRIDTGLSELLRGDVQGAKTNFMDTASRVGARVSSLPGQIGKEIVKPAYADDGSQKSLPESIGQNIGGAIDSASNYANEKIAQAGEGIKSLATSGVDALQNVFKPKEDVTKRAVGDVSGVSENVGQFSSLMDGTPSMQSMSKNDIRDPFFKMGGSETYKNFLKPNAQDLQGGALTLDLFTNDFFKDLGNISNVFGGSKDLGTATDKYIGYEKEKYKPMSRMNYEEGYDRGELDNYNRQVDDYNNSLNKYFSDIKGSVSGSQSIYTPAPVSSAKNIFSSSKPNMSMSAPVQMSMNAPKFSANMSVNKPQMSLAQPSQNMSVNRPSISAPAQQSNRMGSSAPQMSVAPRMSVAPKPAPQMSKAPTMSVAPKMSVAPRMSVAPKPQSKPTSNVFSKVTSALKNIFRR